MADLLGRNCSERMTGSDVFNIIRSGRYFHNGMFVCVRVRVCLVHSQIRVCGCIRVIKKMYCCSCLTPLFRNLLSHSSVSFAAQVVLHGHIDFHILIHVVLNHVLFCYCFIESCYTLYNLFYTLSRISFKQSRTRCTFIGIVDVSSTITSADIDNIMSC